MDLFKISFENNKVVETATINEMPNHAGNSGYRLGESGWVIITALNEEMAKEYARKQFDILSH
jgi:hypothetical protein